MLKQELGVLRHAASPSKKEFSSCIVDLEDEKHTAKQCEMTSQLTAKRHFDRLQENLRTVKVLRSRLATAKSHVSTLEERLEQVGGNASTCRAALVWELEAHVSALTKKTTRLEAAAGASNANEASNVVNRVQIVRGELLS